MCITPFKNGKLFIARYIQQSMCYLNEEKQNDSYLQMLVLGQMQTFH